MKKQADILILNDEHYFGEGGTAKCYYHPNNDNLCIKIAKTKEGFSYLQREIKYHTKIKNKLFFDYMPYAEYCGCIKTNLGTGLTYKLIKDEINQKRSITLTQYLECAPPAST
jgi:hypothetical protein